MKEPVEPSVLDYVKSKLNFNRNADVEIPALEWETEWLEAEKPYVPFPWRSLLALAFALAAQISFEPVPLASRTWIVGAVLYACALALLILAYRSGEWTIASQPPLEYGMDSLRVRFGPFFISLVFAALTFYFMKDNLFTAFNLTLWIITVVAHIRAFWIPTPRAEPLWKRARRFFSRPFWDLRITRWTLLLVAVIGLTLFFRTYQLSDVPVDMTSDHAEKLQDVYDILNGKYSIFFVRNTGREPLYVYLSALVAAWYSGISFLTLKIAAVIGGLAMLPYLYLLGKEVGGKRIGLLAVLFAGIAYWPNVIERFGLRISFYPLFVAPTFYYIIRGFRRQNRNDFILAGLALGLGLNGYMPFRIVPFVVVIGFIVYLFHARNGLERKQALLWLGLLALTSWTVYVPQARFALEHPDQYGFRALSRVSSIEQPLPGPVWQLLLFNLWNAVKMFNWNDGNIWVHSIPGRPALDIVSGALFLIGVVLLFIRYLRSRRWSDLFLILLVPLLLMPSILSLAFPIENPSLNRTGGAIVPVFLIVGLALDGLLTGLGRRSEEEAGIMPYGESQAGAWAEPSDALRSPYRGSLSKGRSSRVIRPVLTSLVVIGLVVASAAHNYDLVFRQYNRQYTGSAWNTREMGVLMRHFALTHGSADNVWVIPSPHWVDTRLPSMWAGYPEQGDIAIPPDFLADTLTVAGAKLFMVRFGDVQSLAALQQLYPQGILELYQSTRGENWNFHTYYVPAGSTISIAP